MPSGSARALPGTAGPRRTAVARAMAGPPGPVLPWRATGGLGLLGTAAVHLWCWAAEGYRAIPTVGPLFVVTGVAGIVLAAAVSTARRPAVDVLGAGMALTVLGAYVLTLTLPAGLFLFKEPGVSGAGALAVAAEAVAVLALGVAATRPWMGRRRR